MKTNTNYILALIGLLVLTACASTSVASRNLAIIKSTYAGTSSEENGQNLAKFAAQDIIWTESKGFPYGGTYHGLAQIIEHVFSRLATEWVDYTFVVEDFVASDDKVIAYGTYSGIYKKSGRPFEARVAHLWKLKDFKIISFEQFVDSEPVNDAMLD